MLPGVVGATVARADLRAGTWRQGRLTLLTQVWRDAHDLGEAQDLCAQTRAVAGRLALAEARGVDCGRELAELRELLREVAARVQRLGGVLRG